MLAIASDFGLLSHGILDYSQWSAAVAQLPFRIDYLAIPIKKRFPFLILCSLISILIVWRLDS